jgi:hypothetical protein
MKAILMIAIMAVLMMTAFAVPMALAEEDNTSVETGDDSDASSDAIALYDDTSNLPVDTVISPAPETTSTDSTIESEAEEDMAEESVSAGAIAKNRIQNWFTFNQEKKAELELKLAKLRLVQAKIAAKNGNEVAMEKAIESHNRLIERVQTRLSAIDGASDEESVKNSATKLVGLERAIQVHEARINKLNQILANENLTAEQRAKIEAKISNAEEVTAKLSAAQAAKQEQIKTKLMAVTGMTEEEAGALISEKIETLREKVKARAAEKLSEESDETEEVQTETSE